MNNVDLSMYEEVPEEFFTPAEKYPMYRGDYSYTQTRFRGYRSDVMRLKDYLESLRKRYDLFEVGDDVFEIKIVAEDSSPTIVSRFRALRATGMRENFRNAAVNVWFSESGHPDFTDDTDVGEFCPEAEGGDYRWAWEYDMMENVSCGFDWDGWIAVDYSYPYKKQWDNKEYVTEIDGKMYKRKNSQNDERVVAYNNDEDSKAFYVEYKNPLLESILQKYNYKSTHFEDPCNIKSLFEKIPNYAGVTSVDKFTATLIAALLAFGSADNGFEDEIRKNQGAIAKDFTYIDGTSQEDTDWIADSYDGLCEGYDFKMKDGKYYAEFRTCPGGW